MLLGGARQIRTATDRNGAAPHDVLAALDGAREHLVFQVTVHELRIFGEPQHLPRLGERAAERFFARDADELRPSGLHQAMDLAHGVEPDEIRHADPYGVDFAGNQHRLERRERPAGAELERIGFCGRRLAIGGGGAVNSRHGDMAHGQERLKVKIGDEAAADQTDAQRWNGRATVHEVLHLAGVIGLHRSHAPEW